MRQGDRGNQYVVACEEESRDRSGLTKQKKMARRLDLCQMGRETIPTSPSSV